MALQYVPPAAGQGRSPQTTQDVTDSFLGSLENLVQKSVLGSRWLSLLKAQSLLRISFPWRPTNLLISNLSRHLVDWGRMGDVSGDIGFWTDKRTLFFFWHITSLHDTVISYFVPRPRGAERNISHLNKLEHYKFVFIITLFYNYS